MTNPTTEIMSGDAVARSLDAALAEGNGLLRLAPTWVPRSFLQPGGRLRLHPDDLYAYGKERGGIDERWLASTTEADNDNPSPSEGLSVYTHNDERWLLRDAIAAAPERLIGPALSATYGRWPVLSKLFDNEFRIPLHLHHTKQDAERIGKEPKPESYYFPPQYNYTSGEEPTSYFGLQPGTTREDVLNCLEQWGNGDNGILKHSIEYPLVRGTGWLVPPGVLHAPGSLCTYEPQWGSDVFSMFHNRSGTTALDHSLLTKDVPTDDVASAVHLIDWDANTNPEFKKHHFLQPIVSAQGEGWEDRWVVYGHIDGKQLFSAKELIIQPGSHCTINDPGASGWLTVQGKGTLGPLNISSPEQIRFGDMTEDEIFISYEAATSGIEIRNTGSELLIGLRYFGPDTHSDLPTIES